MAARESFLDFRGKLRPDVRALKALMPVATAPFKVVLGAVCTYLEHPERFGASSHAQLLAAAAPLDAPAVQRLFTGLLLVVRAGLRSRHKPAEMQQDLEAELKMPAELAVLVAAAVQSRRAPLESAALERRPRCAALRDVDWRVEVTISTGSLARVLQPTILMGLTLESGEPLVFEMSREAFQKMRFEVASALKNMQAVEANPILKIE